MSNTASPSMSSTLGRAAKLLRLLEQAGMTDHDFQQIIDVPQTKRLQLVEYWRSLNPSGNPLLDMPSEIDAKRFQRLTQAVLPDYDPTYSSEPVYAQLWLRKASGPHNLGVLAQGLSPRDVTALVLYYGLADQPPMNYKSVGEYLGVSGGRASQLVQRALRHLRTECYRLARLNEPPIPAGEILDRPVEDLNLSERPRYALRRTHIVTVGQLVTNSEEDLLCITNFGQKSLQEVICRLGEHGLNLKQ